MNTILLLTMLACTGAVEIGVPHTLQHVPAPPKRPIVEEIAKEHINNVLHHVNSQQTQNVAQPQPKQLQGMVNLAEPPQLPEHIKQTITQHINHVVAHVKQQKVAQHTTTAKPLQNELPESVRNVINKHINQIVKHVRQQQQQNVAKPSENVAPAQQNFDKLAAHVQHIMQVAQTHIPLAINAQIKEKQKIAAAVKENVPVTQKSATVPQQVQQIVEQHIPHVINHHVQQQLEAEQKPAPVVTPAQEEEQADVPHVHKKPSAEAGVVTDTAEVAQPVAKAEVHEIPAHVHEIIHQAHTHIPQILNHHVQSSKAPHSNTAIPPNVLNVLNVAHAHIPQLINQHVAKTRAARALTMPTLVQDIVQHVHTHVPQLINHHVQQLHNQQTRLLQTCDFRCSRNDLRVCVSNGKCWMTMDSLCALSRWNCLHTGRPFQQVHAAECEMVDRPKCYKGDM